jgi:hypothetical protein
MDARGHTNLIMEHRTAWVGSLKPSTKAAAASLLGFAISWIQRRNMPTVLH